MCLKFMINFLVYGEYMEYSQYIMRMLLGIALSDNYVGIGFG